MHENICNEYVEKYQECNEGEDAVLHQQLHIGIVDPGIGFGKSFDHNLTIIRDLARFQALDRPILLGTSRKAFIGQILDKDPEERDVGTMATLSAGILNGAHIVRVHNVKMAFETVRVIDSIRMGSTEH